MASYQTLPANFLIPPHFQAVASAVDGIAVYAPEPQTAESDGPLTYKCPNCGGNTQFDVAAGEIACEHCGYKGAVRAARVGLNAAVFEFTLDTLEKSERGWGVERQEFFCQSCGAAVSVEARAITTTCPFCASHAVNLRSAEVESLRPGFVIPFKIQNERLFSLTREWLGKGWFHPDQLGGQVGLDRFSGIYLPFWTFNAQISSDWKAEVGYERQESYYNSQSKSTEVRTRIDWRWENGRTLSQIDDLLIPGTGRLSHLLLERIQPFHLNELMTYSADFLAGWNALAFDISLQPAWDEGKNRMREQAKSACYQQIHSSHVRNFNMSADFSNESWRYILLPVYIASYPFENKTYQVMINGQTGVVAGQKPVAWWKVWLAIGLILSPGILLALIGLPLLMLGGIGIFPLVLGAVLFIAGVIAGVFIYKSAADSEAS